MYLLKLTFKEDSKLAFEETRGQLVGFTFNDLADIPEFLKVEAEFTEEEAKIHGKYIVTPKEDTVIGGRFKQAIEYVNLFRAREQDIIGVVANHYGLLCKEKDEDGEEYYWRGFYEPMQGLFVFSVPVVSGKEYRVDEMLKEENQQ